MTIPVGMRPYFTAIAWLSLAALIGDAWLSVKFGWTISGEMAIIAGVVSVASGLLLVVSMFFERIGWTFLGRGLAALWVPVFAFNCWSNMGVSTATRMGEVQQAQVQQTTYNENQASVEEAKRSLTLFQDQLATLIAQNAWAATVTADGLRAQVADLRKAEISETALGGCKQKCRAIQNKITEVQGQIAVAEQRADLTKRIEATKAVIAKSRETLAATSKGISNTANQSTLYAKLISWNLAANPDEAMVIVANESTGIGFAIILALIATGLTVAGAWPHLHGVSKDLLEPGRMPPPSASAPVTDKPSFKPYAGIPSEPVHVHTREEVVLRDPIIRRWALTDEVKALLGSQGQLKAA